MMKPNLEIKHNKHHDLDLPNTIRWQFKNLQITYMIPFVFTNIFNVCQSIELNVLFSSIYKTKNSSLGIQNISINPKMKIILNNEYYNMFNGIINFYTTFINLNFHITSTLDVFKAFVSTLSGHIMRMINDNACSFTF